MMRRKKLHELLDDINVNNIDELQTRGKQCREIVYNCQIPDDLKTEILKGYTALKKEYGDSLSLAVRSSATAEDSPEASFAGKMIHT